MTAASGSATTRRALSEGSPFLVDTLWLVNGERVGVDPADRGLAYGDGVFETIAARDGQTQRFDWHFERLTDGCRRLDIPLPERGVIEREIAAHCPREGRATIKLIVTRGPGPRGYRPHEPCRPTRILAIGPWPDYPERYYTAGIRVGTCAVRLGENPALAGMKHLARLEQVLAELELRARGLEQGLMLDSSSRVVGVTSGNLFVVHGSTLSTPLLTRCGVKGVMRRAVLAAAAELSLEARERDLERADVLAADELFVTNALIGIWPVGELDGRARPVGTITHRLMQHFGVRRA
jgi:4-amino-4-deoxychorismate lyase